MMKGDLLLDGKFEAGASIGFTREAMPSEPPMKLKSCTPTTTGSAFEPAEARP